MEASLFYFEGVHSLQKSAGIYFTGFSAYALFLFKPQKLENFIYAADGREGLAVIDATSGNVTYAEK